MKILIIGLGVCLCLLTASVQGVFARCNKYEYMELMDMDKDYLNRIICGFEIEIHFDKLKKEYKYFNDCFEQLDKARRAFKSKFKEEPIDCDKLGPPPKQEK